VIAIFAGLLTKVGVYALLRAFTVVFPAQPVWGHQAILILSVVTMFVGVMGAASQVDIRRILSFHIISQIGYITLGIGLSTKLGIAATIFYLIHHIVVKANLFLVGGVIERIQGGSQLKNLGSLKSLAPWLALLFLIPAFSLAGVPPLSGFWAKFLVIQSSLSAEAYTAAAVALLVGVYTLFSMVKIWSEAFWKPHPQASAEKLPTSEKLSGREKFTYLAPIVILCIWTLIMGFAAEGAFQVAQQSAEQLINPEGYIRAVLNPSGVQP